MKRLRTKLTYANVMATIAVFIALGGASFAATQLPKNSVGSKQLKKAAITTVKIKDGAVTGAKIRTATIGTVPNAQNAATLGGQSATQLVAASKLSCPPGTFIAAGICFESTQRPEAILIEAYRTCAGLNMSLPDMGAAMTYLSKFGKAQDSIWAGSPFVDEGTFRGNYALLDSGSKLQMGTKSISAATGYVCAVPPTN